MMKICYIADAQSSHTQKLVNHYAVKGHEIHLISSRYSEGYEPGVHFYPLSKTFSRSLSVFRILNGLKWLFEVKRLVGKIKPDILDAHFLTITGYLGYISAFHPFVMSVWGSDILIEPKKSFLARWAAKIVLKKADFITCTSQYLYNAMGEYTSLDKVKIVPFGVDCEIFKPYPEKKNGPVRTIGIVKALEPVYGIEYLIRAVPIIAGKFDNLKVLIVGGGNPEPYKKLAREIHVENFIEFTGKVPHNTVSEYLARMDVFVMPSLSDSEAVSAQEAQAMEIPVIASRVAGVPEVVRDGVTGILVEPGNHIAIADAVIRLLSNDSLREKMGKQGREHVKRHFNWTDKVEVREKIYLDMINKYKN